MNIKQVLNKLSKEQITDFIATNGSVFVINKKGYDVVEHVYPNNVNNLVFMQTSKNTLKQFQLIDNKYFYLSYTQCANCNPAYFLMPEVNNLGNDEAYANADCDKYCKNNFEVCEGFVCSYIAPLKNFGVSKANRTRHEFKNKFNNKTYEYIVVLPNNYTQNKKYNLAFFTDGEVWLNNKFNIEQVVGKNANNYIFIGLVQKNRNVELPYNLEFAKYIANELLSELKQKYNINKSIFVGQSYGALCGLNICATCTNAFDVYICQSPSLILDKVENKSKCFKLYSKCEFNAPIYISYGLVENNFKFEGKIYNQQKRLKVLSTKYNVKVVQGFKGGHDYYSWRINQEEAFKTINKFFN